MNNNENTTYKQYQTILLAISLLCRFGSEPLQPPSTEPRGSAMRNRPAREPPNFPTAVRLEFATGFRCFSPFGGFSRFGEVIPGCH